MKLIPVHRGKLYLTLLYKKGACKMLVKLTPVYHKNILLVFITNLHPENIKKMLRLPITKAKITYYQESNPPSSYPVRTAVC